MKQKTFTWRAGLLPPLKLPLVYFVFATLCFAIALVAIILYAHDFTGFYYHPRVLAITHLITLGWISANILGTLYIVGPMALQMYLPVRIYDVIVFVLFSTGILGMAAHFWRERPIEIVWFSGCAYSALLMFGIKVLIGIRTTRTPAFIKFHVVCAFFNFFFAGAWGLLLSINKVNGFLPSSPYSSFIAHAHLAAIGWATMMVFGIAYRLLPMFLPAAPVKGILPWMSGFALETGILTFFCFTLIEIQLRYLSAVVITFGILLFFISGIQMLRNRKPSPPPEIPRPDFSMLHAPLAFLSLVISVVIGFALFELPPTEKTLQWAFAYGALGLVGFLSQIVIGLKPKILSVFTWYHAFARSSGSQAPRPLDMPVRIFQMTVFALWLIGLPFFVAGIVQSSSSLIRTGAALLLAALIIATIHETIILRIIWRFKSDSPSLT